MFTQAIEKSMHCMYEEFSTSGMQYITYSCDHGSPSTLHLHNDNKFLASINEMMSDLCSKLFKSNILIENGNMVKSCKIILNAIGKQLNLDVIIAKEKTLLTFSFELSEVKKKMVFNTVSGKSENFSILSN
jgi:hypothetical protein